MTVSLVQTALAQAAGEVSTGEAIAFWILGPVALAGALGLVFARHAVHAALLLVLTMFSIAVLYLVQTAPFLGFVQIIVYTGAVMMLFLFVLMLVGRDAKDSVIEVLRGQRAAALVFGVALAVMLVGGISRGLTEVTPAGLEAGGQGSYANVSGIGRLIFTDYLLPFELTAALLMVAALGAMVLTGSQGAQHSKIGQRETVLRRLRGEHARVSPLPGPGVYATANSVAVPALLPDGSIAPESLSEIIESVAVDVPDTTTPDAHALTGRPAPDRDIEAGEASDTGEHR
ncbi:NADH-quinone oxidoreductase subunit J [Pseudonocardia ammonioxydans]|uniref:NADH-quinone oxidoreductase subunit J n=1 Tax=Pseudonocardia ammonioxydans TaxID=260086 RepID=A0A1I4RXA3_PSUAM|nr:NADH-quinone oxidoreductase subunit J [Pseudonocardia ammonioxydans]SFM56858.1 NADH-quinone oxidoreductase subunit J [Pseudonocardia ammonioxydans]